MWLFLYFPERGVCGVICVGVAWCALGVVWCFIFGVCSLGVCFGGVVRGPMYGWMCAYGCMGAHAYAFTCA